MRLPLSMPMREAVGAIRRARPPMLSLGFMTLLVVAAVFAPLIAPDSPRVGQLSSRMAPPVWLDGGSVDHLLGADQLGRDMVSRLLFGSRTSLGVAFLAVVFSGVIGTLIGMVAGYFGGRTDAILMRITDVALSIPLILLAIVLVAALGPSLQNVVIVIILLLWPYYARQVRGETLTLRTFDYVALARVAGCPDRVIIWRHILPNVMPTVLVIATLQAANVILLEAALGFLGVGIPPPSPAWGLMVGEGRIHLATAWWIAIWPGLAIFLTVMCMNIIGDWLRDWLDPKVQ
ncbi:MAG: ABC transporter permease [Pseudomonadota bacterium]